MAVVAQPPGTRGPFAACPFLLSLPFRSQRVPVICREDKLQTQPLPDPNQAASLWRNPGRVPIARSLSLAGPGDISPSHLGPEPPQAPAGPAISSLTAPPGPAGPEQKCGPRPHPLLDRADLEGNPFSDELFKKSWIRSMAIFLLLEGIVLVISESYLFFGFFRMLVT